MPNKFQAVADFVKKHLSDFDLGDYSPKRLQHCQSKLCLNERQLEIYMKRLRMLNGEPDEESKSLANKNWNNILTLAKTLRSEGRTERSVLELLLEKKFFYGVGVESVNMPTPGEELQNLRRKIYGFLLSECPEEASINEHIWSFRNGDPEDIQKKKYKYFFEIINKKLDPDILLGKIEEEFIFPLLTTFYLHCELGKFNNPNSIDIFLIHSILANKLSAKEVAEFECEPDFEALNLCGWYLTVIEHLELVNAVCGNPFDRMKTSAVNYFDGLLLQTVYRDINDGKGIPEELIPTFRILKRAIIEMKQCCGF